MKLPAIITTDLHLTDKPSDEYRWKLFPWLESQCRKNKIKTLSILGDLTDAKDYHSSTLVNRIALNVAYLAEAVDKVIILKGNHDYLKDGHSFFSFLSYFKKVQFVDDYLRTLEDCVCLFLSHTKNPQEDWKKWDFKELDYVFMHQTVNGAVSENGQDMTSSLSSKFEQKPKRGIYSGDIHVPQKIGDVIYVGSPYPIRFGDDFAPRCLLIDKNHDVTDLRFHAISKTSLVCNSVKSVLRNLERLEENDQVKITINISAEERCNWQTIRRSISEKCQRSGIILHELKLNSPKETMQVVQDDKDIYFTKSPPEETVAKYVDREELGGDLLDAGLDSMK